MNNLIHLSVNVLSRVATPTASTRPFALLPCSALQNSAQVLLTLDNLAARNQYINARNTFEELLRYGAESKNPLMGGVRVCVHSEVDLG